MKAILVTKEFTNAVKGIADLFEKSSMVPSNSSLDVLVTAEESGRVTLEASNMGMYACYELDGSVEETGSLQVNGMHLKKIKLAGKKATLELVGSSLQVVSGKSKIEVRATEDTGRVQRNRPSEEEKGPSVPTKTLKEGLKFVAFKPHSTEDVLHTKIEVKDKVKMMANDSYRGAFYCGDTDGYNEDLEVVLPAAFLRSALTKVGDQVKISAGETAARMSGEGIDIVYPLAEVEVAGIDEAIEGAKQEDHVEFAFKAGEGKEAIEFASSVMTADASDNDGKIDFKLGNGSAECTVTSTAGEATCSFDIETPNPSDVSLGALYAKEFFDALPDGDAKMIVWDDKVVLEGADGRMQNIQPQIS